VRSQGFLGLLEEEFLHRYLRLTEIRRLQVNGSFAVLELLDLKCILASSLLQLLHQVEARDNKEVPKAL